MEVSQARQQPIFDSDLKGAWHYNHVTFTPIAQNFMLYCRLIYMLSILCVRLTINVKVGIPESFKVGWYPPKKLGRVTFKDACGYAISRQNNLELHLGCHTCWLSYFTLVCLWCGRTAVGRCTVTWLPIFFGRVDYHIFLPTVLRCAWELPYEKYPNMKTYMYTVIQKKLSSSQ